MQNTGKLLERLEIATPCQADWAAMSGDERVRFCGLCRLNVYNLSGMSRAEGEALIQKTEGKVCIRMFKREDGTVLTSDCPLGKRIVRGVKRTAKVAAAAIAAFFGVAGIAAWALNKSETCATTTNPDRVRPVMGDMAVPENPVPMMGAPKPIQTVPQMGGVTPPKLMGKPSIAPNAPVVSEDGKNK